MQIVFWVLLFIIGACAGSFLWCQARRLRLKATKRRLPGPRSVCLSCKYRLKWYDNIPIISWLFLQGKCRKCHKKIGALEIFSELGMAAGFLAAGTSFNLVEAGPVDWVIFVIYLVLLAALGFLAIYDGAYGELPTACLIVAIVIAVILTSVNLGHGFIEAGFSWTPILAVILSVMILGGLYLFLYLISRGKWVGDGDWLLGTAIGIAVVSPWLALITLFVANLLACLVMYPVVRSKKNKKIYFGPFLVVAFVVVMTFYGFFGGML